MSAPVRGPAGLLTSVFCAFAALAPVAVAQAQETAQEPEALDPSLTASDEIVVTATGRAAAIQDVPIAITALNAEAIANANIQDLRQIEQIAPSFRTFTGQSNVASTTLFIRGIGTGGDNPGFEPAVGVFIDGVFRNRSGVAIGELPEVERIEVLRGPQGTLFGRNTSAGALSVATAGPEYDYRVFGNVQVGNFDFISTSLGVTGPLIEDVLAIRLEGSWQNRDGYIQNLTQGEQDTNDRDRYYIRGQLLWDIASNASFRLIADTAETNEVCCGAITAEVGGSGVVGTEAANTLAGGFGIIGTSVVPGTPLFPTQLTPFSTDLNAREIATTPGRNFDEAVDEWGVSGEFDWEVGGVNITSITAYREYVARRDQDIDFNDTDRAFRDDFIVGYDTFSQELRFQGEAGPLDWLVGGFFFQENARVTDTIRFGADAAAFADGIAGNTALPIPIPGVGTVPAFGFNLFQSFGPSTCAATVPGVGTIPLGTTFPGCGVFTAALTPAIAASIAPQLIAGGVPLDQVSAQATSLALQQAAAFSNALAAAAPGLGQGQVADNFTTDTTAFAFFTHNEISLLDNLTLTLGARYNRENKQLGADLNAFTPACDLLLAPQSAALVTGILTSPLAGFVPLICNPVVNTAANGDFDDERTENEVTGTGSLAWKVTDDALLYFSYSRGYKSGGFNLDRSGFVFFNPVNPTASVFSFTPPTADDLEFDAEFVNAYEVGSKFSFPNLNTTVNLSGYIQRISGYQVNLFTGFNFQTFNVESLDSRGVDLDLNTRLGDHFTFQGGASFNDTQFESPLFIPQTGVTIPVGERPSFTPRWTLTGAANYKRPIGFGLYGQLYADVRWQTEFNTRGTGSARPQVPIGEDITDNPAFAQVNARVAIGDEDGAWALEFFVRNITDRFFNVGGFAVPEQTGTIAVYPSQPRTWAMQLKFNF